MITIERWTGWILTYYVIYEGNWNVFYSDKPLEVYDYARSHYLDEDIVDLTPERIYREAYKLYA